MQRKKIMLVLVLVFGCSLGVVCGDDIGSTVSQDADLSMAKRSPESIQEGIKKIIKGQTTEKEIREQFGATNVSSDNKSQFESTTRHIIPEKYSAATKRQKILLYEYRFGSPPHCPHLTLLITIDTGTGIAEDYYVEQVIADCD